MSAVLLDVNVLIAPEQRGRGGRKRGALADRPLKAVLAYQEGILLNG